MGNKFRLKEDRSAASTVLAIVVVALVIVAGVTAYVVISNDSDDDKDDVLTLEAGLGTKLIFDLSIGSMTFYKARTLEIYGRSYDNVLLKDSFVVSLLEIDIVEYILRNIDFVPPDYEKIGTERIDTMNGKKVTDVFEYFAEGMKIHEYTGDGLVYLIKVFDAYGVVIQTHTLVDLVIVVENEEYVQSEGIGKKFNYDISGAEAGMTATVECAVDCADGLYGIKQTIQTGGVDAEESEVVISAVPEGLPVDAVNTGVTKSYSTIDGIKLLQKWTYEENGGFSIYYIDPLTNIAYVIELTVTLDGTPFMTMTLTSYS